jgi:hypothetical protein
VLRLVLAALLCIACSGARAQPASEVLTRLPEQLAGFRRNGPAMADPTPGMVDGAIQRFSAGHSHATVYLFARTRAAVPDGPGSRAVHDEYADSIGSAWPGSASSAAVVKSGLSEKRRWASRAVRPCGADWCGRWWPEGCKPTSCA